MGRFSCAICQSERNLKACSGCGNVLYCSTEHQKQNWKEHKGNCRPFRVSSFTQMCNIIKGASEWNLIIFLSKKHLDLNNRGEIPRSKTRHQKWRCHFKRANHCHRSRFLLWPLRVTEHVQLRWLLSTDKSFQWTLSTLQMALLFSVILSRITKS